MHWEQWESILCCCLCPQRRTSIHILDQLVDQNHKTEIRHTEKVINIRNRGYQKLIEIYMGQYIVNQLVRELAGVIMSPRDNNGPLRESGEHRDSRNLSSHCCVVTPSPTTTDKRLVPSASGVPSARGTRVDNHSSTCYKHYDWRKRLTNRFYILSFMRCKYFEMIWEYNLCISACMLYYIYCIYIYTHAY